MSAYDILLQENRALKQENAKLKRRLADKDEIIRTLKEIEYHVRTKKK